MFTHAKDTHTHTKNKTLLVAAVVTHISHTHTNTRNTNTNFIPPKHYVHYIFKKKNARGGRGLLL
jgi:hypothetical protein